MEILKIAEAIEQKINLLEIGRKELQVRAERKSNTVAEYEKALAKTILQLKSGEEITWEGEVIKDLSVTLIEKTARGIVWQEKLRLEMADGSYRNAIVGLQTLQSELNGLQSIFRNLDET